MNKIPKVSDEALEEAYNKFIKKDFATMQTKELRDHIKRCSKDFSDKQPDLFKFVNDIFEGHSNITGDSINIAQLGIYVMIIVDSFYIQKEIDEVKELFNEGEEDE